MPKIKTHRGAAKRFKITGSGRIKRRASKLRHILTTKNTKVKRHARHGAMIDKCDESQVKKMLPYG